MYAAKTVKKAVHFLQILPKQTFAGCTVFALRIFRGVCSSFGTSFIKICKTHFLWAPSFIGDFLHKNLHNEECSQKPLSCGFSAPLAAKNLNFDIIIFYDLSKIKLSLFIDFYTKMQIFFQPFLIYVSVYVKAFKKLIYQLSVPQKTYGASAFR